MAAKAVRSQRGLTSTGAGRDGLANCLSEGELVGRFKRNAADAADDGGAVATDEGVIDGAGADGAPELDGLRVGSSWRIGRGRGHPEFEASTVD